MGLFDTLLGGFADTALESVGLDSFASDFLSGTGSNMGRGVALPISYPTMGYDPTPYPQPMPVMAPAMTTAIAVTTRPILMKIAATMGLRSLPSLSRAMSIVRKLGKMLSPAATAAALGLSMTDLAMLMTASARKKRRSMNPANTRALRRSLRRLGAFDRLACRVSSQLSAVRTGRSSSKRRVGRCRTCRKNPCGC